MFATAPLLFDHLTEWQHPRAHGSIPTAYESLR
jgi:hypothetical protein